MDLIPIDQIKSDLLIVRDSYLYCTPYFNPQLPSFEFIPTCFAQELKNIFMVPTLEEIGVRCMPNRIKKYQLLEAFLSFLLHLLSHKTDSSKYRIGNLEKELRVLLTILGDISVKLCDDEDEEFQKLLAEFEAVANEAGSFVHSLCFFIDRGFGKMNDEGLGVVLNHIDLLKAYVMKFLNLLPSTSTSAYTTPKTSVVDSLLILHSLIYDLEDLIRREDNRIAYVKDQIKLLYDGLNFLQSCIKDIGVPRPSEIGEMKEPVMRIGDLSDEAEHLIISFLVGDAPLWYLINRLSHINHSIERIGSELQEIRKKCQFGSLKVVTYCSAQLSSQDERNSEVDDVIVGFDDKEAYILDQLVRGGTERLQVISIFGMPGIGKTTLAKKLYNHPSVNYWFDKLSWCIVSQTYKRQSILADILSHIKSELGKDTILEMEEESVADHIYKTLKGRRYLIVMDDVWDSNVWDNLRRCFPDDENGSRILVTNRNKDVAPPDSIIYALPSLSNDQCWELLEKKLFDNKPCPPDLLRLGKQIAAKCRGLPLAVVVIAGILSTMDKEASKWEEVERNLASYIFHGGDNSVMQVLELSYKYLPDYLKPCFLYFGAFREDKEISVRNLMRLWIAEGFIHKEEKKSAEDAGEEYLMELIDKSLVMVAKRRSDGGVKSCFIHDLLRDLCLKKSEEENFTIFSKNYRHSIIYQKRCWMQGLTLSLSSSYGLHDCSFYGRGLISPFRVRDMKLLRVLHVGNYPIGIGYLVNLRYLIICDDLPASIGILVHLEYLRVETYGGRYLPPTIVKMKKLRYIHAGYEARYHKDCNSSQTNNLEFLSTIIISKLKDEEMLKCSPHLRKLKCKIEAYQHFDLRFFTQLESLNVRFYRLGKEEIRFPANLKRLTLSGSTLPWEEMSMIGRLEKLEVLKLEFNAFAGGIWYTREGEFQKLKFLKLCINHLTQWHVASKEHFSKLQRLVLINCCNLQETPSEIGEIPTLQLIEVKGQCKKSLVESAKIIQQQQLDLANEELRVIISTTA